MIFVKKIAMAQLNESRENAAIKIPAQNLPFRCFFEKRDR